MGEKKSIFSLNYMKCSAQSIHLHIHASVQEITHWKHVFFSNFIRWYFCLAQHKWAQVSAWLRVHLCSCSRIQSRHFLDWLNHKRTVWWMLDGTRADFSHHQPPLPCFHSGPFPSFLPDLCLCGLRSLGSIWHPRPCLFSPSPPVPRPHAQPVTSFPSWVIYLSFLQRSNSSKALLYPHLHA